MTKTLQELKDLNQLLAELLSKTPSTNKEEDAIQTFCHIILGHSDSIVRLSEQNISISSSLSIVRAQLESFAVFHLLFIHGTTEERRLRFWLWMLEGLKERLNYDKLQIGIKPAFYDFYEGAELIEQIENDKKRIEKIEQEIQLDTNEIDTLTQKILNSSELSIIPKELRKPLIDKNLWKFNLTNVKDWKFNKNNKKTNGIKVYSITDLCTKTSIPLAKTQFLYKFLSMHAHNGYLSFLQNQYLDGTSCLNVIGITCEFSKTVNALFIEFFLNFFNLKIENNPEIFSLLLTEAKLN